jgi:hypothetical protein
MKNKITILIILCLAPLVSFAAIQTSTGDVGEIRYHDASITINSAWKNVVWFELTNVDKALCVNNRVTITEGNDTAISMLLAAKMSSKKITVTVDDTVIHPAGSTYCKLQYLSIK